jgi:hypothetical protein
MWDDDIDEVARALTAAGPSADLKARVVERIRHDAPPRESSWLWWAVSPVALAIVVVIAMMFRGGWHAQPTQAPGPLVGRTITPPAAAPPAVALSSAPATFGASQQRTTPAARPLPADAISTVAPLPQLTVERLNLERVQLDVIPPPETIALKTLELTPLELAPLTPEDRKPH